MKCFEYLLEGKDIVAVLQTGFGKSPLFQLLPDFGLSKIIFEYLCLCEFSMKHALFSVCFFTVMKYNGHSPSTDPLVCL